MNYLKHLVRNITLLFLLHNVFCSVDLFIESEDAQQLLGVKSQIWYVKNGTVNANALKYAILVPNDVDILTYYWQNKRNSTFPYAVKIDVQNAEAIYAPKLLNIRKRGHIPSRLTSWSIVLNCTGKISAQSRVNMSIQFPLNSSLHSITSIVIQRRKICSEKTVIDSSLNFSRVGDAESIIYLTVGVLLLFVLTLIIAGFLNHRRRTKTNLFSLRSKSLLNGSEDITEKCRRKYAFKEDSSSVTNNLVVPNRNKISSMTPPFTVAPEIYARKYVDPRLENIDAKIEKLLKNPESLCVTNNEIEGTFGKILRGLFYPSFDSSSLPVLVKTVSELASELQREMLIREGLMLSEMTHENILAATALITPQGKPPLVLFHCSFEHNLKKYLQSCHTLMTKEVVLLANQVLEALSFLHSQVFLHKDIACRNCVIDRNLNLKVTDCALSRDLFPADYHCLGDNENRPVKWLAYESLTLDHFSPASDVWSWGVLVWELMTLGHQPYLEVDPFEMVNVLQQDVRLAQPVNCPDELFKAMTYCWKTEESERPRVSDLLNYMTNFLEHLHQYV